MTTAECGEVIPVTTVNSEPPLLVTKSDPTPTQADEWRLRYSVGDLVHYTE